MEKDKRPKREKCRWKLPQNNSISQNIETLLSAGIKFDSPITPPATPTTPIPTPKSHPAVAKKKEEKHHPDPLRRIGGQNLPKFKRNRGMVDLRFVLLAGI